MRFPRSIESIPGLETSTDHALVKALAELATFHQLTGCVLISFTMDRVGVDSCGRGDYVAFQMASLADRILVAINDGTFPPEEDPAQNDVKHAD